MADEATAPHYCCGYVVLRMRDDGHKDIRDVIFTALKLFAGITGKAEEAFEAEIEPGEVPHSENRIKYNIIIVRRIARLQAGITNEWLIRSTTTTSVPNVGYERNLTTTVERIHVLLSSRSTQPHWTQPRAHRPIVEPDQDFRRTCSVE